MVGFLCLTDGAKLKVSSVLNRNVKEYGGKNMIDGSDESCWNSDQGSPQVILIGLKSPAVVSELHLMFQGGFAGQTCEVHTSKDSKTWEKVSDFYPENSNDVQSFPLPSAEPVSALRIVFNDTFDFFGRVTVYHLRLKMADTVM